MHKENNSFYGIISDQIFLSKIIVEHKGFYLHACGVNYKGSGFVFMGHSGAGKSTIAKMFKGKAQVLCDDRVIIKESRGALKLYGTWSHGEVEEVNCAGVPLKAIFFLRQAKTNSLFRIENKKLIVFKLCACLIKPFVTSDWWRKVLNLVEKSASQSDIFMLSFNKKVNLEIILEKIMGGKYV
jgi:energy-coupling factor transporter ATP-binding protein EcfA2